MSKPGLTNSEKIALLECQRLDALNQTMGPLKMVSMQQLEEYGLVKRLVRNAMIIGWQITPAGREWEP